MSTALAVAGVTEVMRNMLEAWLIDQNASAALGGLNPEVTAIAPDSIDLSGAAARPRLNLYLHQVSHNSGWRNEGFPSRDSRGARVSGPPLALDLHYLLTAYGQRELHAEVLLGYGMQLLHEVPVLDRAEVEGRLPPPLRPSQLGRQVEMIKISPVSMSVEDLSKLWSAMQAHYRPTAAYHVSVVLIESPAPGRVVLPVLERNIEVAVGAGGVPAITAVAPPQSQPGAVLGDRIVVEGVNLDGANRRVRLEHRQLGVQRPPINARPGNEPERVTFDLPTASTQWPVGVYQLSVLVTKAGETVERETNRLSLAILPDVTTWPVNATVDAAGDALIALNCRPHVRPHQRVSLLVGAREVMADPHPAQANALTFRMEDAIAGRFLSRLRVDGLESLIVRYDVSPPTYLAREVVIA